MATKPARKKKYKSNYKPPEPGTPLNAREIAVLKWCGKGATKAETAKRLGKSVSYVKRHVEHIFRKLQAKTLAHAVAKAYQKGILLLTVALFLLPALALADQTEDAQAKAAMESLFQYWVSVNNSHGDSEYGTRLREQHMTPEQIAAVRKRFDEWKLAHPPNYETGDVSALIAADRVGDHKALPALKARAERGEVGAQVALALQYYETADSFKWWHMAAEQGNTQAMSEIAKMYEKGMGVTQDYAEAAKWYRRVADGGDQFAQAALGRLYENGQGVGQDWAEAYYWYNVASAKNNFFAAAFISDVRRADAHLTPEQIAAVKKRAAEWKPITAMPAGK